MADKNSYLHVLPTDVKTCLLCSQAIEKETFKTNGVNSWLTLKEKASRWSLINIPKTDDAYEFRKVDDKVRNVEPKDAFGVTHERCRIKFYMHLERYQKQYGIAENMEIEEEDRSNDSKDENEINVFSHPKFRQTVLCLSTR